MNKVFIGGSRRLTRLNAAIKQRLDRIAENGFPILIGDANGADKAVQQYMKNRCYKRVEVFCTNGVCRNNLGDWPIRKVKAARNAKGFEFYAVKDRLMAEECSVGFMLWDGRSKGTQANILRLLNSGKKVLVYVAPPRRFVTLRSKHDWEHFFLHRDAALSGKDKKPIESVEPKLSGPAQAALF